jgi:CRP-like cAMP-binding protein
MLSNWVYCLVFSAIVATTMAEDSSDYIKRIEKLFKDSRSKNYPKNQLIHYQGDPLSQIYFVKKGYIKAYTILDSGDTRTILLLSPGDIFPLSFSASMDWEEYKIRYFYQSLTDTELQALPSDILREHLEGSLEMMNIYMQYLTASNEAIMNQLEVMKNKKAIDKVALLLPYLITKCGKKVKPGVYRLQIKLSHQEIADLSGVTRETTTTLIKELEKNKIIDQSHGNWIINTKNLEKLTVV